MSGGVGPAMHPSANQQPAQPVDWVTSPTSPHAPAFLLLLQQQLHSLALDTQGLLGIASAPASAAALWAAKGRHSGDFVSSGWARIEWGLWGYCWGCWLS